MAGQVRYKNFGNARRQFEIVVSLLETFWCMRTYRRFSSYYFFPRRWKKKNVVELDVDGNLRDFLGYSLGALFDTYVLLQRAKLDACG